MHLLTWSLLSSSNNLLNSEKHSGYGRCFPIRLYFHALVEHSCQNFGAIRFSINIVQHQFSFYCFYFRTHRTTNLFHATKWLFIYAFTFSLVPCNTYRIALGWRHLLHQKSLHLEWSAQSAKSFLCFSSSSVVLDFQSTLFLLSPYLLSLSGFHEVQQSRDGNRPSQLQSLHGYSSTTTC